MHKELGDITATAVTDPTENASIIAALKGLLSQLQGGGSVANFVQEQGRSAIYTQNSTVVVAGTPVQLSTQTCSMVIIAPYISNTDTIYVGTSSVDALSSPPIGIPLEVGGGITLLVNNANLIYIDAVVSGEGAHVFAL